MTVPTLVDEVSYTGPQTNPIAYTFRIFQDSDLLVTQTALDGTVSTLVLTTDYTVTGALSYTGGTITLTAGDLATGVGLTITRAPEAVQDTSLQSQGAYDAKVVENGFDLLTMICQWLQNQVDRALVVSPGTTPVTLPSPEALALLQWNAGATGLQNIAISDLGDILAAGNYKVDAPAFTPGVTTVLTLTQAPGTVNNAWVYFDGGYQQRNTYTVSGTTLTLSSAVPVDVTRVEVIQAGVLPINTPADGSVATATLQNLSVTGPKIAAATITADKIAGGVLPGANLFYGGDARLANGTAVSASTSYQYGKCELCYMAMAFATVSAGSLTQGTGAAIGSGYTFKFSGLTVANNSGVATSHWRFFVASKDAAAWQNRTLTFSCQALHDKGSAVDFRINVYKADVADVFTAVTAISGGAAVSVPSATGTTVYNRAVAMGSCGNGVLIDITAQMGGVTLKNFEIGDVKVEADSQETAYDPLPYKILLDYAQWFYEVLTGGSSSSVWGCGQATSTTTAVFVVRFSTKRTIPTITQTLTSGCCTVAGGTTQALGVGGGTSRISTTEYLLSNTGMAAGLVAGDATVLLSSSTGDTIVIDARFAP